ncbi:SMP-30/gluconolactonase/LRE family protein [Frigidibacter sp. ROC022]|uniref:SMP-30/gluconolactonase/LRE family protein n=1 Tax=Frigidibacter sp. ROC022 TaxID=2971796 RepID=UPI00215B0EBC|nr:SMP-30/gluconolactonase/LRE family protein [Frigidibacter sp. ROC022]MCR8725384.1 SMP-30/gluconolactonase/LRE family protein [Frigidibacter sp. ROC022]
MESELLLRIDCTLGETPVVLPGSNELAWIDAVEGRLHILPPGAEQPETIAVPGQAPLGMVMATSQPGMLLVSCKDGIVLLDRTTGKTTPFAHPLHSLPHLFYNDGKVDSLGRLWIGTAEDSESAPRGILFRMDGTRAVPVDAGLAVCNGPAITGAGDRLYLSDSTEGRIHTYRIDAEGRLLDRRLFVQMTRDEGLPDGVTLDNEDCLWVAHWGGGCVSRYAPDGTLQARVELPVPLVTSLCFGGDDNRQLFITTARVDLDAGALAQAPLSGSLFTLRAEVAGPPAPVLKLPA